MLLVLAAMLLAVGYGAGVMMVDGFVGIGVGWRWYHDETRRGLIWRDRAWARGGVGGTRPMRRFYRADR